MFVKGWVGEQVWELQREAPRPPHSVPLGRSKREAEGEEQHGIGLLWLERRWVKRAPGRASAGSPQRVSSPVTASCDSSA